MAQERKKRARRLPTPFGPALASSSGWGGVRVAGTGKQMGRPWPALQTQQPVVETISQPADTRAQAQQKRRVYERTACGARELLESLEVLKKGRQHSVEFQRFAGHLVLQRLITLRSGANPKTARHQVAPSCGPSSNGSLPSPRTPTISSLT